MLEDARAKNVRRITHLQAVRRIVEMGPRTVNRGPRYKRGVKLPARENHIGETLRGLPNPITIWSVIIEESSGQRNAAPNDSSVKG